MPGERDERGRFVRGNSGGPGRPPKETEASYRDATLIGCPSDTWRQIVERAVKDALAGDAAARTFLAKYLMVPAGGAAWVPVGDPEPITADDLADVRAAMLAWESERFAAGDNVSVDELARGADYLFS